MLLLSLFCLNLIIYKIKLFSLFLWLLAGGTLDVGGSGSISPRGPVVSTWRLPEIPASTGTPGSGSGNASFIPVRPPEASYFANVWVTSQSPAWFSSPTTCKASSSIKFPLWEILSGFHFPAQTLTATHVPGIFVLPLVGQFLRTKCFIVTKLLFKKLIYPFIH